MTAAEIRSKFVEFFKRNGHAEIKSAPLIPENDPTVLFTTAGMHPLVPFLLGEKHPAGKRLVNVQKCLRTGDIEEVGDTTHLTFFEMLGNWSLGDYFKEEAIRLSFEFLTGELEIPIENIWISCFAGDETAPRDDEAAEQWRKLGIPDDRIVYQGKNENWWGPAGETGPCGPDTEMFIALDQPDCGTDCGVSCNCGKYVEVWNDVFMQYNKTADGRYQPLEQKNVDTGMGLERMTAVMQNKTSPYETELFAGLFRKITEFTGLDSPHDHASARRVAEHMRAASFLLADGVQPGNVDQGYVLRRLLRRAIREGRKLGIQQELTAPLADQVIEDYAGSYPELKEKRHRILEAAAEEEKQFRTTLEKGTKEFEKVINSIPEHVTNKVFSGRKAFYLYETFGFPLELTKEMAEERGFSLDEKGFQEAYAKHQEKSRQGAQQKFKGGLADHTDKTAALHTATHIMHEALRQVLGTHVKQAGSNITEQRLRFDFTHPEKVTKEQLAEVEKIVNDVIEQDLPVKCEEMTVEEAKDNGAVGLFEERYGDLVKVYQIGNFSYEICGGPHVERTGELGRFRIKKEESSSKGVRRIKAV
ncbi:MAG: alanine--tRNA ligase, partial [Verrucomicrobiota bacterium]